MTIVTFIDVFSFVLFSSFGQSESLVVCDVDEDLVKKLREFRFRKETNNAAIVSKSPTSVLPLKAAGGVRSIQTEL